MQVNRIALFESDLELLGLTMEAAADLLSELGPGGVTLREVARRAGVTHAAPYRHFQDKQALLAAVATEGFVQLRAAVEEAVNARSPEEAMEQVGMAYVRYGQDNPARFRVMFGDQVGDKRGYPELIAADQAVFDLLVDVLRGAQSAGALKRGDVQSMAMIAWSMVVPMARLMRTRSPPWSNQYVFSGEVVGPETSSPVSGSSTSQSR